MDQLQKMLESKGLSSKETKVATMVIQGLSNKEIANQLFIQERTVKIHISSIYIKMDLSSRARLIVRGLMEIPEYL